MATEADPGGDADFNTTWEDSLWSAHVFGNRGGDGAPEVASVPTQIVRHTLTERQLSPLINAIASPGESFSPPV